SPKTPFGIFRAASQGGQEGIDRARHQESSGGGASSSLLHYLSDPVKHAIPNEAAPYPGWRQLR
ncbi:hypothetical protein Tco_0621225, partial [Tanacetum coccineum]